MQEKYNRKQNKCIPKGKKRPVSEEIRRFDPLSGPSL